MQIDSDDLSPTDLSSILKVTRPAITSWVKNGCPHHNDRFKLSEVLQWRAQRDSQEDPLDRQRRLTGDKLELELVVRRGELIDREEAVRTFRRHITDACVVLNSLPESLALLIPGSEFTEVIKLEAERIVKDAQRALAQGLEVVEDSKAEEEVEDE